MSVEDLLPTVPVRFDLAAAEHAADAWGCNCGPGALAAMTGLTLDEVRPCLGDFEVKRYTNPTLMFETLRRLGVSYTVERRLPLDWPRHGLVRIQWGGPWMADGVPIGARYRQTHWVGARHTRGRAEVFDINCINVGGWVPMDTWTAVVVPWLLREAVPRADGSFSLTHVVEVSTALAGREH